MSQRSAVADPPRRLVEGQRLDQPTFHALYEETPPDFRAELIGGMVYLPGPIGHAHGSAHVPVVVWLGYYAENTPGVEALPRVTTILGWRSELEPDAQLRVLTEYGGRTRVEKDFLRGAPELVVEIAEATRYIDLGPKLTDYEQAGVREYVLRAIDPDEIFWFGQEQGRLVQRPVSEDGLYRSSVFPGLWLDPDALLAGDGRRLRAVLDRGCATPEHATFAARLAEARSKL
jgi:Uma2 family endonuclease